MVKSSKNKQIGFIVKSLSLYYDEQYSPDDVSISFEEYLLYQLKFGNVTGILNKDDVYEIIKTYEEMVNDPNLINSAENDCEGKYYRLYSLLDNDEFSLFEDLRNIDRPRNNCQYGDMCYFLKGEKPSEKYRIYFEIARVSRFFNKTSALGIYLPYKNDKVIRNEQRIMMADYGNDNFNTYTKNNMRTVSWYLTTHNSESDFDFIFDQFDRGENFERLKETQIDIYADDEVCITPKSKPKQKRISFIDRIISKKITIDCID